MAKSENRQSQIPIIVKRLKTFFKERHDVSLIFLFGSFVSKQTTAFSDIDVGIFFKKVPNFYEINDMKEDLTALLKKEVDLVVLNDASPVLKMQAMTGFRNIAIHDYQIINLEILKTSTQKSCFILNL